MYPLDQLLEYLRRLDPVTLCELLDIDSEDLVDKFMSRIRERRNMLETEVEILPIDDSDFDEEDYQLEVDDEDDDFTPHYQPFPEDDDDE